MTQRLSVLKNLPFEYQLGKRYLYAQADGQALFTDNETNAQRLFGPVPNAIPYVKDAFHRAIVNGEQEAMNPNRTGTKACVHYQHVVPAGGSVVVRLRLTPEQLNAPLKDVDRIIAQRQCGSRRVLRLPFIHPKHPTTKRIFNDRHSPGCSGRSRLTSSM